MLEGAAGYRGKDMSILVKNWGFKLANYAILAGTELFGRLTCKGEHGGILHTGVLFVSNDKAPKKILHVC